MERVRVKEFGESKDEDWMSQSCFYLFIYLFIYGLSLKIFSRNSLHFMGIRVFIVGCMRNTKDHFSLNRAF